MHLVESQTSWNVNHQELEHGNSEDSPIAFQFDLQFFLWLHFGYVLC